MGRSRSSVIQSKLEQKPLESKKCLYAIFGSACVLLVFAGSAFLILTHAEAAKEIVELANLVVMFFGAVVTTLITGTAVMDWKAVSVLSHMDEDEKIDSNEQAPDIEVNQRPYKARWYDNDSVLPQ
jgi:hypothetical protein